MIRGRKEGSNYASWFIGFDHDDTFGLPNFPELPTQSPRTPVQGKPVSRATSLESLLPSVQSRDVQTVRRSVTPTGTQTQTTGQLTEETSTQTCQDSALQTNSPTPQRALTFIQTTAGHIQTTAKPTQTTASATQTTSRNSSAASTTQTTSPAQTSESSQTTSSSHSESSHTTSSTHTWQDTSIQTPHIPGYSSLLKESPKDKVISRETHVRTDSPRISQDTSRPPDHHTFETGTEAVDDTFGLSRSQVPGQKEGRTQLSYQNRGHLGKDAQGIYKEAFDGARRAEEFKFRVKFDKLIGDLHLALHDINHNGLPSVASPSYGDVMLSCKDKVKDLLRSFTQRMQLVYENLGPVDSSETGNQKVKQNVFKFIEELINETLDLNSDEAVSDLSSLSDDSTSDQTAFEDLLAQAIVTKLLENNRRGINESFQLSSIIRHKDTFSQSADFHDRIISRNRGDYPNNQFNANNESSRDYLDSCYNSNTLQVPSRTAINEQTSGHIPVFSSHSSLINGNTNDLNHKSPEAIVKSRQGNNKRDSRYPFQISETESNENLVNDEVSVSGDIAQPVNGVHDINGLDEVQNVNSVSDEEVDIVREFEQLKEFVKKTRSTVRPKVTAIPFDDASLCEVQEDTLSKTQVDRDEDREEFHTRYSIFDRVHNYEQPLPDFSRYENIDFTSDEVDPDLLSMNLAIIPEETEEELEQEEEDEPSPWKANWLFKGQGVSPYQNMGKTVNLDNQGSLYIRVPRPDENFQPKIGHRDIDQLSEFSEYDLLGGADLEDDSDEDEENTYYANTSLELARISGQRKKVTSSKSAQKVDKDKMVQKLYNAATLDDVDSIHIQGPIVEPSKQDLAFLEDLVPADNDDPRFVAMPESVTVQEGDPFRFSCRVAGTAPIDVFWYREGEEVEELEESEDVDITSNGDKHSILIYNTSKQMGGQYMCIAVGPAGKTIKYLIVTVKDNKQELKKPEFLKGLKDVEVTEGQSVKFRVKVKGYPPPRINWYKDGVLLKNSKTCRLEKFGNRDYILTIDSVTMNDDAEYTVSARNVAGKDQLSAQVIVEPQSELPNRRQLTSSNTNSGTSDSDSERSSVHRPFRPFPSTRKSTEDSQNHLGSSARRHLDEEVTIRQSGVAEKDDVLERSSLISQNMLEVLRTADEIIQEEKRLETSSRREEENVQSLSNVKESSNSRAETVPPSSSKGSANFIVDLALPDKLDDFPLPANTLQSSDEGRSRAALNLSGENHHNSLSNLNLNVNTLKVSPMNTEQLIVPALVVNNEKLIGPELAAAQPDIPHNQNGVDFYEVSTSGMQESSLQNTSHRRYSSHDIHPPSDSEDLEEANQRALEARQQMIREQYSRDYEIPHPTETRKWSVTLNPVAAEVVNRQNEKVSPIEISVADASPASSINSSQGDASSQSSSRRQSVDSGVSVSSKQRRTAPVHMVGHTTEDEVPESRTEFNTDGTIELPSVNRLKAMFSNSQDNELGDGSFKRVNGCETIHSITARNVPKEKLEKLRAYNQNVSTSASSSSPQKPVAKQASSGNTPPTPHYLKRSTSPVIPSTATLSASSKLSSKPSKGADLSSPHHHKNINIPANGSMKLLDPDKDPVLIYPATDPEYLQHHHTQFPSEHSVTKTAVPHQNHQQNLASQKVAPLNTAPKTTQPQPTKLVVKQATPTGNNTEVRKNGPRIRSGCISARAAFWQCRIEGDQVDVEEFPQMVEDGEK